MKRVSKDQLWSCHNRHGYTIQRIVKNARLRVPPCVGGQDRDPVCA